MTTRHQNITDDTRQDAAPGPAPSSSSVRLLGRLGTRVEARGLPSGDELVTFTVIVDRPRRSGAASARLGGARVDAIPCQALRAGLRRRVLGLTPGCWVEVEGTLRRRFWRAGGGLNNAMEVEVTRLTRIRSAVQA